jgi:hypothetical protein
MKKIVIACGLALAGSSAFAKLPAPPATPEAKAKAAEAAARTAWSGKVEAHQLCQAQDRVAAKYRESAAAAGKQLAAPAAPACADPGPFAYTPPEQKPIEAAGAHSPAGNASSPPNTNQPAAAANPTPKQ